MFNKLNKQFRIRIDYEDYGFTYEFVVKVRTLVAASITSLLIALFFTFRTLAGI